MKHPNIILFLTLLTFTCDSLAQTVFYPGFRVGLNRSKFSSDAFTSDFKNGVSFGALYCARLEEKIELIGELSIEQRGAVIYPRDVYNGVLMTGTYEVPVTYLGTNLVVMGSYYLVEPYLSVQGGPMIGINRYTNLDGGSYRFLGEAGDLQSESVSLSDVDGGLYAIPDYGLYAGLTAGLKSIRLNLRLFQGLNNYSTTFRAGSTTTDSPPAFRNVFVQLSLMYLKWDDYDWP